MVEPLSEEMKTRVRMWIGVLEKEGESGLVDAERVEGVGEESDRRCEAVMRGPIVLVWRCWANAAKDLEFYEHM